MNRFVLSGCAVLLLVGIAGWGVSQGPYVPEIPTHVARPGYSINWEENLTGRVRERMRNVLDLNPLPESPPPRFLRQGPEECLFAWEPQPMAEPPGHFDRCQVDPDGFFEGKHVSGRIEFVGMTYPAFDEQNQLKPWWPLVPFRLNGDSVSREEVLALQASDPKEWKSYHLRVSKEGALEFSADDLLRFPVPQVCAFLRLDEESEPLEGSGFAVADAGTGFSSDEMFANTVGSHFFGYGSLAIWHDAAVDFHFSFEHLQEREFFVPFQKGKRTIEGLVEVEILDWFDSEVELFESEETIPAGGAKIGIEVWSIRRKPTEGPVTTAVLFHNFGGYSFGVEASVLLKNGDRARAYVEPVEGLPLMLVSMEVAPEQIDHIRLRQGWGRTGAFVTAHVAAMPGTPSTNLGVRDLAKVRFPIQPKSMEQGELEEFFWLALQLQSEYGPRYPERTESYEWGDGSYLPLPAGKRARASDLVQRWQELTGSTIRFEVDKGHFVLGPEPNQTWLEKQWEALRKMFRP